MMMRQLLQREQELLLQIKKDQELTAATARVRKRKKSCPLQASEGMVLPKLSEAQISDV